LPDCCILFFVTCWPAVSLCEEQDELNAYSDLLRRCGDRGVGYVACPQRLMRHSDIKTTMDFYANVDDAIMEAVRGESRNSQPAPAEPTQTANDATPLPTED
jgi:hypothetical protein